ncbi:hypothetical protein SUGI_0382110 [Cryptomeria japonica]|nr:hypothetical protein SUGI_0382110 [Cryptomeria japonica]
MIRTGFRAGIFLNNRLIDMYSKCMSVVDAQLVFEKMNFRDVSSWNNLIAGYVKNGSIEDARQLFDKMPEKDGVSWNAIIAGYTQHGYEKEALTLFGKMRGESVKPSEFTFGSILQACASLQVVEQGRQIHTHAVKFGFQGEVFTASSVVDMYSKCKRTGDARQMFDKMPERNLVSWNAMISGYSQNGCSGETLKLFRQMYCAEMKPDRSTFACVLSACACLSALELGKQVHDYICKFGLENNVFVSSALVDIYAKCGSVEDARQVFDKMTTRSTVSWSSMILGYAQNGRAKDSIQIFEKMLRTGTKPDQVTFIGVLTACSHAGLIEEGRYYFNSMSKDHNIALDLEHYACMVDLFGRAGYLDEAEVFINNMPFEPDAAIWGALLGACRIHGNLKIGERAANYLFELEPRNAGPYILLSHMYAETECWDNVAKMRKLMKERRVKKEPGCSWTEVQNRVHSFMADDLSHPQANEIYQTLERLIGQMEVLGYVSPKNTVLKGDDNEHEWKHIYHSEKLAIAFALKNTPPGTPIRIVKNLRVCDDCHIVTKFISQTVGREIVLRDVSRFHHFKNGMCSCGDYW